jgi:LemA protein
MSPLVWYVLPLFALAVWALAAFNRGIKLKNQQAEAWSGVDVQLKKRHDLVPPLAESVRAYSAHESGVFHDVAHTRSEGETVKTMRKLIALAESYPDLKASEGFRQLMSQLVIIEDDLQYARRYFNGSVRDFRNFCESFPTLLIAKFFHFQPGDFFEVENVLERNVPDVKI